MASRTTRYLPFDLWPSEDRQSWLAAFEEGNFLDEAAAGAHLAPKSRADLKAAYSLWLGYIDTRQPDLLALTPAERVNQGMIAKYVKYMRGFYQESSVVISLHHMRLALRLISPAEDWAWLLNITKRVASQAPAKSEKHHLVTSERLYALGMSLMNEATTRDAAKIHSNDTAKLYRDGFMIALLAVIPLRRRTFAVLSVGRQVVKSGRLWSLDIPTEEVKNRRQLEFSIPQELSARLDVYLGGFRKTLLDSKKHDALWVSTKGNPMREDSIYEAIRRRTREAFGFPISLHRFRHAAATFWSVYNPANVRGSKDLLGHISFGTTEKYYNMTQSRTAGRTLARALESRAKRDF